MDTFKKIDKDALTLARAIGLSESGPDKPNYRAVGDNGTSKGAYQWQKASWENHAQQVLGDSKAQMTPENQDKVAYGMVKKWKDKGFRPEQVASMWNAGEGRPDGYKNWKGTTTINGKKISYDTPAYVRKVKANYEKIAGGYAPPPQSYEAPKKAEQSVEVQPEKQKFADKDLLGKATQIANYASLGIGDKMGEAIGTLGGLAYTKAKDLVKGTDHAKYYDTSTKYTPLQVAGEAGQALLLGKAPTMNIGSIPSLLGKSTLTGMGGGLTGSLSSGDTELKQLAIDTGLGGLLGLAGGVATGALQFGDDVLANTAWKAGDALNKIKGLVVKGGVTDVNLLHKVANLIMNIYNAKPQAAQVLISQLSRVIPEWDDVWEFQKNNLGSKVEQRIDKAKTTSQDFLLKKAIDLASNST